MCCAALLPAGAKLSSPPDSSSSSSSNKIKHAQTPGIHVEPKTEDACMDQPACHGARSHDDWDDSAPSIRPRARYKGQGGAA